MLDSFFLFQLKVCRFKIQAVSSSVTWQGPWTFPQQDMTRVENKVIE